ncbi:MAG: RNA polymerase sigma factor [Candidatus Auribacterota bacterium]|jgi:RNA polymerase sigma-70 factor (ECF subfamily)|nr:RNA polymerase sigma factor [Candidatus Auribacterota bacterium]
MTGTNGEAYSSYSDDELIFKAKNGDASAFDALHVRYLKKILNYVNRIVSDFQKAEEITQETFLQVYRHLETYQPCGKLSSWIFKIATNLSKNELRSQRRKKYLGISLYTKLVTDESESELIDVIPDESDLPNNKAEMNELSKIIERAIQALPLKYREVMLVCEVYGYSYQEASEILNCSRANIGIRLCRARRKIKKIINASEDMAPYLHKFNLADNTLASHHI